MARRYRDPKEAYVALVALLAERDPEAGDNWWKLKALLEEEQVKNTKIGRSLDEATLYAHWPGSTDGAMRADHPYRQGFDRVDKDGD